MTQDDTVSQCWLELKNVLLFSLFNPHISPVLVRIQPGTRSHVRYQTEDWVSQVMEGKQKSEPTWKFAASKAAATRGAGDLTNPGAWVTSRWGARGWIRGGDASGSGHESQGLGPMPSWDRQQMRLGRAPAWPSVWSPAQPSPSLSVHCVPACISLCPREKLASTLGPLCLLFLCLG